MTYSVKKNRKDHADALLQKLINAREDDDICDLIIRIDNHDIRAHRSILAVYSDYFKAMLRHDTIENKTGIVNMKDVDYEAVKNCIDFLYSGEISFKLEHCDKHLHVATLMQLHTICDDIITFMCSNVSTETFFEIKSVASKYDLERMNSVCDKFALKHLDALAKKVEFNSLEKDYIVMLLKRQESSHPKTEDDKLKMLIKWIKADEDARQELFDEMIKAVDLSKISKNYGKQLAMTEPLCYGNVELMRSLYISALDYQEVEVKPPNEPLKDSSCNSILAFNNTMSSAITYNANTGVWKRKFSLHEAILESFYVATIVGDVLYVISSFHSRRLFMINWKKVNGVWKIGPGTKYDHGGFLRSLHYDGYIYVCGNNSFERFSLSSNKWQGIYMDSSPPDRCAMVEFNGVIYTIGGFKNGTALSKVCKYDSTLKRSRYVRSMSCPRATPGVCVYGNKIYAAGGFNNKFCTAVEQYNPDTDSWTRLSGMLLGRSNFALIVVNNKILACGCGTKPCAVEEYDPKTGVWTALDIMFKSNYIAPATVAVTLD